MGLDIKDGKLRISAGYDLKVPTNVPFAMEGSHISLSLEFDVEGDSTAVLAQAENVHAALEAAAKLKVFADLGVNFTEDENGILRPVLVPPSQPAAAPVAAIAPAVQQPAQQGGYQQGTPPKATTEDIAALPTVVVDFGRGKGGAPYKDQRPLKVSGKYAAGAADFKNIDDKTDQAWILKKDGTPIDSVVQALNAAGVDSRAFNAGYGS